MFILTKDLQAYNAYINKAGLLDIEQVEEGPKCSYFKHIFYPNTL